MAQGPHQPVEQQILHRGVKAELHVARHLVVERVDLGVELDHAVTVAHAGKGGGDGRGARAGLVGDAHDERGAAAVDHRIGELRGDDLAPQPVLMQRVGEALGHFLGEIAVELAPQIRIVRHRAVEQFAVERQLGVGEQHRKLRPRQRFIPFAPLGKRHLVGQEFDRAVELAVHFQRLHQALLEAQILQPAPLRQRERQRLLVIVAQHQPRHFVGHLGQQRVARLELERAGVQQRAERDLDIDLDVGGVDAGRIVDGVGVEPDAGHRRLDAAALRHAEIGALADHLAAQIGTR